jgi:hypothetical protein
MPLIIVKLIEGFFSPSEEPDDREAGSSATVPRSDGSNRAGECMSFGGPVHG